jgi:FPC/CPF motif-containing protein YcgG
MSSAPSPALTKQFEDFIRASEFPCVGAKSALARGTLRIVICRSIRSGWNDLVMHRELLDWSRQAREAASDFPSDFPGDFRSLAFIFDDAEPLSEVEFERALWERVQSLTDKDAWLGLPYDHRVSNDPDDPHFSLSFGGEAFFVVGMHPAASRPARRFARPVMVFNLHEQFERLRAEGRFESIQTSILERDRKLAGSVNPMLARHGERSEAAQYSGRIVGPNWHCPFSDPRSEP